jgi:hypothetical protein
MKKLLIYFISLATTLASDLQVVQDPVADFLNLRIEDRYSEVSEVSIIHKVSIDLDLDGQAELLIGHNKMWLGDNFGIYFAIYRKRSDGSYDRLTDNTQEVRLPPLLGNGSKFVFLGQVDELGGPGLLISNYPHRDSTLSAQRIESRQFLSLSNGVLRVQELPGLDLTKPSEKKLFEKYSGQNEQLGSYLYEPLTAKKLTELGYALPDWTKLPVLGKLSAVDIRQKSENQETRSSDRASAKIQAQNKEQPASSEVGNSSRLWFWITGIVVVLLIVWSLQKRQS